MPRSSVKRDDGSCDNLRCTCVPCACSECGCGVATLGDMERRVMDVLWDSDGDEVTGRAVAGALPAYAYTTIVTVLDRLTHKGLVRRRVEARTIRFAATGTRASYAAALMLEALRVAGEPATTLATFVAGLPDAERKALRQCL